MKTARRGRTFQGLRGRWSRPIEFANLEAKVDDFEVGDAVLYYNRDCNWDEGWRVKAKVGGVIYLEAVTGGARLYAEGTPKDPNYFPVLMVAHLRKEDANHG